MQFLTKNGFRIAIVLFVLFLAVPFIIVDKQLGSPQTEQAQSGGLPVGVSKNPLAKFFDRIAKFYGFKKNAAQDINGANTYASAGAAGEQGWFDFNGSPVTIESSDAAKGYQPFTIGPDGQKIPAKGGAQAGQTVQEYVRMEGKTYEVVTAPTGKKYVLTDNGPVSFDEIMKSTISKEDYEAAKKIAPSLSDEELPYAINSPYGVKGYLERKEKGLLTYEDNPSLFGGPQGGMRGGSSSALFGGPDGHSMFGKEDGAGDASAAIAAKYARVRREVSLSRMSPASSYSVKAQKVDGKYAEPLIEKIAESIFNKPMLGNTREAGIPKVDTSAVNNKKDTGVEIKSDAAGFLNSTQKTADAPPPPQNLIVLSNKGDGAISENEDVRRKMTAELLGTDKIFFGEYTGKETQDTKEDKKPITEESCRKNADTCVLNPWIFPTYKDGAKINPGLDFVNANRDSFSLTDSTTQARLLDSDLKYTESQTAITGLKSKVGQVNFLMIDGIENDNIKVLSPQSYHYKVFTGLIGKAEDIAPNGNIDVSKLKAGKTLIVVPDLKTVKKLEEAGFTPVLFDSYAVSPKKLETFYGNTLAGVQALGKATKKVDEELTKKVIAELTRKKK